MVREDRDDGLRFDGVRALRKIGDTAIAGDLAALLNMNGDAVRNELISTLGAMTNAYVYTLDPNGPNVEPDAQEWNYVNFLVYQDPACTNTMEIGGNGIFAGTGTIYVPTGSFVFDGNNATLTGSQLVANTVNIQSGNITINFDGGNTAQPNLPRLSE